MKVIRLEKFQSKKCSNFTSQNPAAPRTRLRKTDWDVLMMHDPLTGKLDLKNKSVICDISSVKRLLEAKMISPNGTLTPIAHKKCAILAKVLYKQRLSGSKHSKMIPGKKPQQSAATKIPRLSTSDRVLLNKYDRESGNLLKHDPETGWLDEASRRILREPVAIQRLIDSGMLLPGGWLTEKGKIECARFNKMKARVANGYSADTANGTSKLRSNMESRSKRNVNSQRSSKKSPIMDVKPGSENNSGAGSKVEPGGDTSAELDLQAFFENLPGRSLNIKKTRTPETIHTTQTPLEDTASAGAVRYVDAAGFSRVEDEKADKRKRKRGGDGTDGTDGIDDDRPDLSPASLRDLLHVGFKRKNQILLFFGVVFLAVVIGTFLVKPKFEATAQILVKLGRENVFTPATATGGSVITVDREEHINSEIEILKSPIIAEKVIAALGIDTIYPELKENKPGILAGLFQKIGLIKSRDEKTAVQLEQTIERFQKALKIEGIKKSNVIQINFRHTDPQMSALVVNKMVDVYLDQHLKIHKLPQSVKFFQEQSRLLKSKQERSEEELKSLKRQYNVTNLEEERSLLLKQSADLRTDLNTTLSAKVEAEKRIAQLDRQLASTPKTIEQGEQSRQNDYLISSLEARLVDLELEEKELTKKYTDESRLVRNVRDDILLVKRKLINYEKKSYGSKSTGLNPTYQHVQQSLFENEAELNAIKAKAETQNAHLVEYQTKLDKLNQIEVQFNQLEQQLDVDRENYRLYLTKFEESRISDAMDSEKIASVSLIQPARPPLKPVSPKKMLNIILAIFLGAFGGLGLAFFMEYLDDKIEKVEDVEETLGMPVLASLPDMEKKN